jgi:hypothetical protein
MNEGWHKARTLAAKRLAEFIRSRPAGVTIHDLKAAGLTTWGLDRLLKLGHVRAEQVREPERGPRAYHWLWTADTGCAGNCATCDMPNAEAQRPAVAGTLPPLVGNSVSGEQRKEQ